MHLSAEQIPFGVLCPQKLSTPKQMQGLPVTTKCPIKKMKHLSIKSLDIPKLIYWTTYYFLQHILGVNASEWSFLKGLFYLPKGIKMGGLFVPLKRLWNYFVKTFPWGRSKNNWANSMSKHNEQNIWASQTFWASSWATCRSPSRVDQFHLDTEWTPDIKRSRLFEPAAVLPAAVNLSWQSVGDTHSTG